MTCRNSPGEWDAMISYTQKSPLARLLAEKLYHAFRERQKTVWLDVYMNDKSEAAMKEAVESAGFVLCVVTGVEGEGASTAYFEREFCLKELRWAVASSKCIQPVIDMADKPRIGELISMAPADLRWLGGIDWVDLNTTDCDYFNVGVNKILEKVGAAV
eukprot:5705910-Prymnesium_polylepis.2